MYKLKTEYRMAVAKHVIKTKDFDVLGGVYDLETWVKNGYRIFILEKVI
jgi:hypothetical protein